LGAHWSHPDDARYCSGPLKIEFKKTYPSDKARSGKVEIIDVPKLQYLMVSGGAGPASADYASAIATLYPLAYALKFASKLELERDYVETTGACGLDPYTCAPQSEELCSREYPIL